MYNIYIECISFIWKRTFVSKTVDDMEKCLKQMLYYVKEDMSYRYLFYLAIILKRPINVTFIFLNGYYIFLSYILIITNDKFLKRYLFICFA